MQNSVIYLKRQYVVSRKILGYLFKCNLKKHEVFNALSTNVNFHNHMNRLCLCPLSHSVNIFA